MTSVAVIVPVFNGAAFLTGALDSVLAQTRPATELWVVDDGSGDDSGRIAAGYPQVRLLSRPCNGGQAAALNDGIEASGADWLAFLDADDLWLPDKLERQCAALAADPALEAVVGYAEQFSDDPRRTIPEARRRLPARLPSALLVQRRAWQRVGRFRTDSPVFMLDWWARADADGLRCGQLDATLYRRRLHAGNLGRDPEMRSRYLSLLAERLRHAR